MSDSTRIVGKANENYISSHGLNPRHCPPEATVYLTRDGVVALSRKGGESRIRAAALVAEAEARASQGVPLTVAEARAIVAANGQRWNGPGLPDLRHDGDRSFLVLRPAGWVPQDGGYEGPPLASFYDPSDDSEGE